MQNRIASLFELDELLNPDKGRNGDKIRRRHRKTKKVAATPVYPGAPAPPAKAETRPVAQSFDRGDPIRCQHGHAYRPVETVQVPEPADTAPAAQSVQFEADYTVESFEDSEDDESTLRLADVEAEDRLASQEVSPSWSASV